jgi:hypothetical protein
VILQKSCFVSYLIHIFVAVIKQYQIMPTLSTPIAAYPVLSNSPLLHKEDSIDGKYTEMEKKLHRQYGTDITQLRQSLSRTERLKGVEYDEHGIPQGDTVMEWFDELDQKLITHFGEEYREPTNKRRSRWNKDGQWKFDIL